MFQQVAGRMKMLPESTLLFEGRGAGFNSKGEDHSEYRILTDKADGISLSLLESDDMKRKALAILVFAHADRVDGMPVLANLLGDHERTLSRPSYGSLGIRNDQPIDTTVHDLVRSLLYRRLGLNVMEPVIEEGRFLEYWNSVPKPELLASEWVFRFNKAQVANWKKPLEPIKKELAAKTSGAQRAILIATIQAHVPARWSHLPKVYTEAEVLDSLKNDIDKTTIRKFLNGDWNLPGSTLKSGPNSKIPWETRAVVLRHAPQLLEKEDAQWIYELGHEKDWIRIDHLIAAAQLNPQKGVEWLKKDIEISNKTYYQSRRCILMDALWSLGGESQIPYIKDRYFEDSKPEYNSGGLQEDLIIKLGKNGGKLAAPLLKALVLDKRFASLGWAATRAFATNAAIILGEETKEVMRYLTVEHRMGVGSFEQRPQDRDKYLVDTTHVLMQTEAFQIYLQSEVLKRSQETNDTK